MIKSHRVLLQNNYSWITLHQKRTQCVLSVHVVYYVQNIQQSRS